jgi:hypothetical protein
MLQQCSGIVRGTYLPKYTNKTVLDTLEGTCLCTIQTNNMLIEECLQIWQKIFQDLNNPHYGQTEVHFQDQSKQVNVVMVPSVYPFKNVKFVTNVNVNNLK